jgi:hypothetical protein
MPYFEPNYKTKMRNTDRILVLEVGEGGARSTSGSVDNRLFTGENKLHARLDPQNSQWYLQYESGLLSDALKGRWTSFSKLREHVEGYFARRNIKVKEVID